MTYKIEKDIPIPKKRPPIKGYKYPLREMEIGDSFLVEGDGYLLCKKIHTHTSALKPKKFRSRTVKEGMRVWRIK